MRLVRLVTESIFSLFYFSFQIIFRSGAQRKIAERKQEAVLWQALAHHLFERQPSSEKTLSESVHGALSAAAKNLGLRHAILLLHKDNNCELLAQVQGSYKTLFHDGEKVDPSQIFNGLLSQSRENLAVDSASLTEWHKHPARRDLGWETFVGSRADIGQGTYITLGFYDFFPRESLYSMRDKKLVQNLARWVGVLIENESTMNLTKPDTSENFIARHA